MAAPDGRLRAMTLGKRKMPDPMTTPITIREASIRPSLRGSWSITAYCLLYQRVGAVNRDVGLVRIPRRCPLFGEVALKDRRDLYAQSRNILRSEEHTSELQSPMYLVCRLLLEKKNI